MAANTPTDDTTNPQPKTYDRLSYKAIQDSFTDGRVTITYESPYSGTTVEITGFAADVTATSFYLELDDGREWGVFEKSIRTTKNSRRASGRIEPKNGRLVGHVEELRIHGSDR